MSTGGCATQREREDAVTHPAEPTGDPASPPCLLHEADPLYAGFAPPQEVAAALAALLAEERTLARAAALTGADRAAAVARALTVRRLGAAAGGRLDRDFLSSLRRLRPGDRAQAVAARHGAVAAGLRRLLPRLADDRLHAALSALCREHETMAAG